MKCKDLLTQNSQTYSVFGHVKQLWTENVRVKVTWSPNTQLKCAIVYGHKLGFTILAHTLHGVVHFVTGDLLTITQILNTC